MGPPLLTLLMELSGGNVFPPPYWLVAGICKNMGTGPNFMKNDGNVELDQVGVMETIDRILSTL